MSNLSFNFSESPFEAIKHIENGIEIWYARELQLVLNYKQWRRFNDVILLAQENLGTVTESVFDHIAPTGKMVDRPQGGGVNQLDYKLSRLACYHIALCCDSRGNDAVKMAKHYFAVKTRQAELTEQAVIAPSRTPLSEILDAIDHIYKGVGLKKELIAGVKINAAKHMAPDAAIALEEARQPLITNTAQKDKLVTPTEIGKELGISGQAVNKLLIERGLQIPNEDRKSKKEPAYLPTEKGREYSDLTLATGSSSASTFQQLRWYESVIDLLR